MLLERFNNGAAPPMRGPCLDDKVRTNDPELEYCTIPHYKVAVNVIQSLSLVQVQASYVSYAHHLLQCILLEEAVTSTKLNAYSANRINPHGIGVDRW